MKTSLTGKLINFFPFRCELRDDPEVINPMFLRLCERRVKAAQRECVESHVLDDIDVRYGLEELYDGRYIELLEAHLEGAVHG